MSKEIKNIWQAVSEIQAELPVIDKTAKNDFFKSNYTPLDDVVKRVYPLLAERNVACSQILETPDEPDHVKVRTVLYHWPSETQIESSYPMPVDIPVNKSGKPSMNKQQGHGSTISYARRYALTSILGIVCGDEDDDGGTPHQQPAQDNTKQELANFATWLKEDVGCTGKDDLTALLAWLASTDELKGVTNKQAVTSIQHSRMLRRALDRICEADGASYELIMENARDFYMRENEKAEVAI